MSFVPDPIELMNSRIERLIDEFEEGVCMSCRKKVDYDLICMSPIGDGPAVCWECSGIEEQNERDDKS